jgi:hypothetical protein
VGSGLFEELAKLVRIGRFRESYYAVIGSYMDESIDPKQVGIFAVGGLLGRGVAIFELERRWEKLRKRSDIGIKYFKASECERGAGEFAKFVADPKNITPEERSRLDAVSHEFLETIVDPRHYGNYLTIAGVGIVQNAFYDVIQDANARAILGASPYRLGYDLAMIQCAAAMKQLCTSDDGGSVACHEDVSFVCDENEEHSPLACEAYRNLKRTNPVAAQYMATFSSADDKKCEPLQAADAAIFEIRRALNVELGQWKGPLRKQFGVVDDSMFLIRYANKENLLRIVATNKPGEPLILDAIMEQKLTENMKFRFSEPTL